MNPFRKIALKLQYLFICIFIGPFTFAQTDYSDSWEDFYSYNNVKDFVKVDNNIYAVTDNAAFIYNLVSQKTEKISSIQGLSGKETTSIYYSKQTERFIIGYKTGLVEIIDNKGKITIANDIERLNVTGEKQINDITEFDNILYLSTPFGIVQYDIERLNFGDTYYIDAGSNPVFVNQIAIANNTIYAATIKGIYAADINNPNLIDFNNWKQPQGDFLGDFTAITEFDNTIFTAKSNILYKLNGTILEQVNAYQNKVLSLNTSEILLTVGTIKNAYVLDLNLIQIYASGTTLKYDFDLNNAIAEDQKIYIATTTFGILEKEFTALTYQEVHPEGPTSNQVFSITAQNNHLWIVYGGYNASYTPLGKRLGYSHYNGLLEEEKQWVNTAYDSNFPARDLVHITLDPLEENLAYISSWNSGILLVEDDKADILWDDTNSGLEDLYPDSSPNTSIRINGSAFDEQQNLWIANAWVPERLKKYSHEGNWSSFDLSSIMTNPSLGLSELVIDKAGSVWIGSRRNGVLVYNESGNRKRALITEAGKGSLPDLGVKSLVVDSSNRIWIGTQKGLVVFTDAAGLFDASIYNAKPIIIVDDGIPKKLLGDQPINTIAIDGAQNKWFGTDTGGALNTSPLGDNTLFNFNKDNSPLPSNRILKIKVDNTTGKVFFATDKGIVAFNSNVVPYGETLGDVYAYPNPVRKEHDFVTIDGRKGTHIPKGTNIKILDTAGRLVYETNIKEGTELKGGKVIWNKTNLGGRRVASGVYIVLLTSPDKSESSSTKIAIIN